MKTHTHTFPKTIFAVDCAGFIGLSDKESYSGTDILDADDVGHSQAVANGKRIAKRYNMYEALVKTLTELEDIISGIEAEADNKGIDLAEARHWWVDARKLLDEIEDQQNEKP